MQMYVYHVAEITIRAFHQHQKQLNMRQLSYHLNSSFWNHSDSVIPNPMWRFLSQVYPFLRFSFISSLQTNINDKPLL